MNAKKITKETTSDTPGRLMFLKSVGISGTVSGSRWRWTGAFIIRVSIVFEGACTPQTKAPYPEAWDFAICSAFVSY